MSDIHDEGGYKANGASPEEDHERDDDLDTSDMNLARRYDASDEDPAFAEFIAGALGERRVHREEQYYDQLRRADEAAKARHESELAELTMRISRIRDRAEQERAREVEAQRELDGLHTRLIERRSELHAHRAKAGSLEARLRSKRFTYPVRVLLEKTRQATEISSNVGRALAAEAKELLVVEQELHNVQVERRELAKNEQERRVRVLREQQSERRDHLAGVQGQLDHLRRLGLTGRTAGFLVWVANVGFLATGWLFARVLDERNVEDPPLITFLTDALASAVTSLAASITPLGAVVVLLLAPLLFVALLAGALIVVDRIATRLTGPLWGLGNERRESGNWLSLPSGGFSKRAYTQLLAQLPIFLFAAYTVTAVAAAFAIGNTTAGEGPISPAAAITYFYIGIFVSLVFAAVGTVYVLEVTEVMKSGVSAGDPNSTDGPPDPEAPDGSDEPRPSTGGSPTRRTWEVPLIATLLVVVLGIGDVWLSSIGRPLLAGSDLIGVTLLLTANGLVAGMGMTYRGLYVLRNTLRFEIDRLELEVQRLSELPMFRAQLPMMDRFSDRLDSIHEEFNRRWARMETMSPEVLFVLASQGRIGKLFRWFRIRRESTEDEVRLTVHASDELLEPELVEEIALAMSAASKTEGRIRDLEERVRALEKLLADPKSERLNRECTALRDKHARAREAQIRHQARQARQVEYEVAALRNAYAIGGRVRRVVRARPLTNPENDDV